MVTQGKGALAASLVLSLSAALSCSSSAPPVRSTPPTASEQAPAPPSAAAAPTVAESSSRPPPPTVVLAMAGEPTGAKLSEARLVPSGCEDLDRIAESMAQARIHEMRWAVDASFQSWARQQPGCWEAYRPQTSGWGTGIGDSFGAGGLGMSGIGQGGGGRGEGIGLGAMGTIGHGSGSGRGHGYGSARKAASASGTNNQVVGVDEADIVKTDGTYVYLAMNGALHIIEALRPRRVSTTKIPGHPREMFLQGDRAVVYASDSAAPKRCTYGYDCTFAGDGTSTKILVLDVSDRTKPRRVRQIDLSGSLIAARRIGNAVHTVVADGDDPRQVEYETWPPGLPTCGTKEAMVRKLFANLKRENERKIRAAVKPQLPTLRDQGVTRQLCDGMLRTRLGEGRAFTTVVSFDMADDAAPAHTAMVQSRPGAVFASRDALYFSVGNRRTQSRRGWYSFYRSVDEVSEVHKFRIGEAPGDTKYLGSGIVPGHVLNQFAMDEWYGYLRIATTKGRVPNPDVASVVSVLAESEGGNLVRVGAVDSIAPGEDIRSVRFDGDRGYVVTFKKTDPLFVLDLYDPSRPRILGELKIPGYSTYMHRIQTS